MEVGRTRFRRQLVILGGKELGIRLNLSAMEMMKIRRSDPENLVNYWNDALNHDTGFLGIELMALAVAG